MGNWIVVERPSTWQPTMPYKFLKCSKCGYAYRWWHCNEKEVCPKCGDKKQKGSLIFEVTE